jgi:hypothetical protein
MQDHAMHPNMSRFGILLSCISFFFMGALLQSQDDTKSLTELSVEQAVQLIQTQEFLNLDGLNSLSLELAEVLGRHGAADELSSAADHPSEAFYSGVLTLNGITKLDASAATSLAKQRGGLSLAGLTSLPLETAQALANHQGWGLHLSGVSDLSPDAARSLGGYSGKQLHLAGLTTLSPEVAQGLSQFRGDMLDLGGLTELSPAAAAALTAFSQ